MQTWHHVLRKSHLRINEIKHLRGRSPFYCSSRAWDVCAGEPAIVARGRFSAAQVDIARYGVGSVCRLGHDRLRFRLRILAERSRVHPIGLGHSIELAWLSIPKIPSGPDSHRKTESSHH